MSLIRNLDPESTGFVDWRQLMNYFVLLQSRLPPSRDDLTTIALIEAGPDDISYESWMDDEVRLWFLKDEGQKDQVGYLPFDRKRMIMEQLWSVNAQPVEGKTGEFINVNRLISILGAPNKNIYKTYGEYIFAPTKKVQN